MILVIKTTVTVLDPRMGKHQCVTMRTKGIFFFFFEEMSVFQKVCVYQGNWGKKKKNLLQNQTPSQAQDQCQTI